MLGAAIALASVLAGCTADEPEDARMTEEDRAALGSQEDQVRVDGATVTYQGQPAAVPAAADEPDYLDELERLANLRDQGIITEEDFQAKKGQLLGL